MSNMSKFGPKKSALTGSATFMLPFEGICCWGVYGSSDLELTFKTKNSFAGEVPLGGVGGVTD